MWEVGVVERQKYIEKAFLRCKSTFFSPSSHNNHKLQTLHSSLNTINLRRLFGLLNNLHTSFISIKHIQTHKSTDHHNLHNQNAVHHLPRPRRPLSHRPRSATTTHPSSRRLPILHRRTSRRSNPLPHRPAHHRRHRCRPLHHLEQERGLRLRLRQARPR